MKKLVKVQVAFDLMNQGEIYEANVEEPRTKALMASGYLALLKPDELLIAQPETEIEGTSKVGGSAPRAKKTSGKVSA